MNMAQLITTYNEAVYDTDRDKAIKVIRDAVNNRVSPEEIIFQVIIPAIEQTINHIREDEELSLAQHFMTAQIASDVIEEMLARFETAPKVMGRVVIGTSYGDLHALGKRIVTGCLRARLIEVTDLGVNVSPERFVDEAVAHNAEVIGISSMMIHTARGENGCLKVRQILKERGLDHIKLVVGGAPYRFNPELYKIVQADGWARDGITASRVIADLIAEVKK
ncbi:MAG: cobalamin B12-binding domain-containing protein [Chloroflexi bacterium]|nr:cobalamin B12-binding domain-containing protein [Chloroflexota bacterium]